MLFVQVVPPLLLPWFAVAAHASGGRRHDMDTFDLWKNARRTAGGIHVPIYRKEVSQRPSRRRASSFSAMGLGDVQDITYNVLIQVGQIETPLVLDTGSSDLWVISDKCTSCSASNIPVYPQSSFQYSGLNIDLRYGDSRTGTHATGSIGEDHVGIAGITLDSQFFASINDTDTSVTDSGSAGIFGLGFPVVSSIWRSLISRELTNKYHYKRDDDDEEDLIDETSHRNWSSLLRLRDDSSLSPVSYPEVFTSFETYGPLVARLVAQNSLASPMITIALQRDSVDVGGNMGVLSIGELPEGVKNESLTWVPIPTYGLDQGGLAPPADALSEKYPLAWEVPMEGIYIDGKLLPESTLLPKGNGLYGLVDTGNSLIRGQQDLVDHVRRIIGGDRFLCNSSHSLSFKIGGTIFPIDPRDFVSQSYPGSLDWCEANLETTDPPGNQLLHSWSLGDPFMKSTLVSFYYGSLTYPSRDPPRMGFLSTVPSNADVLLKEALGETRKKGSDLPLSSDPAPSGTYVALSTGIGGVPQALHTGSPVMQYFSSTARTSENTLWVTFCATILAVLVGM